MINWKNTAENLGLVLVGVIFGSILGYQISMKTSENTLKVLIPTIETAIKKETTAIHNTVKTEIRKIKSNKGEAISVDIKPTMDGEIESIAIKTNDSIPKKKGFFKRLFNKD